MKLALSAALFLGLLNHAHANVSLIAQSLWLPAEDAEQTDRVWSAENRQDCDDVISTVQQNHLVAHCKQNMDEDCRKVLDFISICNDNFHYYE